MLNRVLDWGWAAQGTVVQAACRGSSGGALGQEAPPGQRQQSYLGCTAKCAGGLCRGVYQQAEPGFSGRCTAPLLLDRRSRRIVSNESKDIVRLLNNLHLPGCPDTDLCGPPDQLQEIQQLCETIYETVLPWLQCCATHGAWHWPGTVCYVCCVSVLMSVR